MKLIQVRVEKFRNFVDSSLVPVQPDITCLVGKNESGKTAFLQALYLLNPARPNIKLSIADQYPAWLEKQDRLQGTRLEDVVPISAAFDLEPAEVQAIEQEFGAGVLGGETKLLLRRDYGGNLLSELAVDEGAAIQHLCSTLPAEVAERVQGANDFEGLLHQVEQLQSGESSDEVTQRVTLLKKVLSTKWADGDLLSAILDFVEKYIPKFFYYDQYSNLPYSANIAHVLQKNPAELTNAQLTARSLLRAAAADEKYLL